MKTKETTTGRATKAIFVSTILLLSLSATANTINATDPVKSNMFVFYLTAVLFFAVYFIYTKISRTQKSVQPVNRVKHYHYRKVIKRTA